jgi:surface protein
MSAQLPSSSLSSLTLTVSVGSPPNASTYEHDIPLSDVVMGSNSIMIPNNSSVVNALNNAPVGTSVSHSLKAYYGNGVSVLETNGADFVTTTPPPPPIVLDSNGITIKYTGAELTSVPTFIQASPRGTLEWFAVVDNSSLYKIPSYAINMLSGEGRDYFTPPGESSPVIFNNIVTTLMTYMDGMFSTAPLFNEDISSLDTSNVGVMRGMFSGATIFNRPIGAWNTSNVGNMDSIFAFASEFDQDISNWNVSNVTSMNSMFSSAWMFNHPINSWNVSNVNYMNGMFSQTRKFNQPLNLWNVSNVYSMQNMFYYASKFNQNINMWDVINVKTNPTKYRNFSVGATDLIEEYNPVWT